MRQAAFNRYILVLILSAVMSARAEATSGMWSGNPGNGDWHVPSNWSSVSVPNGPADIATFGVSSTTSVFLSASTQLDRIVFNPGASAYTITTRPTRTLTVSGAGIVNHSGLTQTLVAAGAETVSGAPGAIRFTNNAALSGSVSLFSNGSTADFAQGGIIEFTGSSRAGAATLTVNGGAVSGGGGGYLRFYEQSSAEQAALVVNGSGANGAGWGTMDFYGSSTAAQAVITVNGGVLGGAAFSDFGGRLGFWNNSTAANAVITNRAGSVPGGGRSIMRFQDNSTASSATIINDGAQTNGAFGGTTQFSGNASAGNALLINNGSVSGYVTGGETSFSGSSTAGAATLIANGGPNGGTVGGSAISFGSDSTGGTPSLKIYGNGLLSISQHNGPGVTIGSLEGTGLVYLGGNTLSIGSNNLSTAFSGLIQDGGPYSTHPTGGSIAKIGSGTLVLAGHHIYTGQTIVNEGKLLIKGSVVTPVVVNGGILGGTGTVGTTTIQPGATLSPGDGPGILHVAGDLTLSLGSIYLVELGGSALGIQYDQTAVVGAVALSGATLSLSLGFRPQIGMTFTVLNNDGSDGVSGTFAGLPEGAAFAVDEQSFTISYQAGSGNDVVVTAVVPEPGTWSLMIIGAVLIGAGLRRRSRPYP